jgi:DNA replication licensing factor MCM7
VQKNTKRYVDVVSQAVDAVMPKETKEITYATALSARMNYG